jgi:hypothetical protein
MGERGHGEGSTSPSWATTAVGLGPAMRFSPLFLEGGRLPIPDQLTATQASARSTPIARTTGPHLPWTQARVVAALRSRAGPLRMKLLGSCWEIGRLPSQSTSQRGVKGALTCEDGWWARQGLNL